MKKNIHKKKISFFKVADNKSNKAEFIRIPPDANVMNVKELLNKHWSSDVGFMDFDKNPIVFNII